MIKIKRITSLDMIDIAEVNKLLSQQSPGGKERTISRAYLDEVLKNSFFYLLVAYDEDCPRVCVGMATIFFQRNLARWIGEIHDVVVDEKDRGNGIGKLLTKSLMDIAKDFCVEKGIEMKLFLTSRPSRTVANALYQKLGFVLVARSNGEWGTNLYKIIVGPYGFRGLAK